MKPYQQKELKHLSMPKNKLVSIGERKLALNKLTLSYTEKLTKHL